MVSQSDRCLCVVLVDEGVFAESKVSLAERGGIVRGGIVRGGCVR